MYDTLLIEDVDRVRVIRLNRPNSLNACNRTLWAELGDALASLGGEGGIRAAILTGEGRAFCVGADLKETVWAEETAGQSRRRIDSMQQELARQIIRCPIPVIAALNGYALGGGLEIALACDYRIAAETALLGFPEARVGSFITGGASAILPRLVGPSQAKRLLFLAENIDAREALGIGLVDEVVEPQVLVTRSVEFCRQIAENAPLSISTMKSAVNRACFEDLESTLALETQSLVGLYGTADHKEGPLAFREKRKPNFRGA